MNWNVDDWEPEPCESARAYMTSRMTILGVLPDLVRLQLPLDEVRFVHSADDVPIAMAGRSEDGEPPELGNPTCVLLRPEHARKKH